MNYFKLNSVNQTWLVLVFSSILWASFSFSFKAISFLTYITILASLGIVLLMCFLLHKNLHMMLLFSLLVLSIVPQAGGLLPHTIRIGYFDVYQFDLLTAAAFLLWIAYLLIAKNPITDIHLKIIKTYFAFLIIGVIPILVGLAKGQGDLLYAYRFFFYFVWVPVLAQLLRNPQRATQTIHILVIANLASVIIALTKHFMTLPVKLHYLDIHHELNLFVCLVLFSLLLMKKSLFKNRLITFIAFIICTLALFIDSSRKMYLAFTVGSVLLFVILLCNRLSKKRLLLTASAAALLITTLLCLGGINKALVSRYKSIFVVPSSSSLRKLNDDSVAFRLYSLMSGIEVIREHPFLGVGAGEQTELNEKLNAGMYLFKNLVYNNPNPHNCYISVLVYYGIPITCWICYVLYGFIRVSFRTTKKNIHLNSNRPSIALGMIIGFVSFMLAMFFEGYSMGTIVDLWLFLGLTIGFAYSDLEAQSSKLLSKEYRS